MKGGMLFSPCQLRSEVVHEWPAIRLWCCCVMMHKSNWAGYIGLAHLGSDLCIACASYSGVRCSVVAELGQLNLNL